LTKRRKLNFLARFRNILRSTKKFFCQLLQVLGDNGVRAEISLFKPEALTLRCSETETDIEILRKESLKSQISL
jgi:hypothetical protein